MRTRGRFLALSLSFLFLLSAASAQSQNSSQDQNKEIIAELNQATWISDVNWDPENSSQVKVVIHSEIPKPVSIQEMPDYTGRSGSFQPMKSITLNAGKNTVLVPVNGRGTLGIVLTDSNNGVYYKQRSDSIPDPEPLDAIPIAFYGAASTFLTFYGLRFFSKFKLKRGYIRE